MTVPYIDRLDVPFAQVVDTAHWTSDIREGVGSGHPSHVIDRPTPGIAALAGATATTAWAMVLVKFDSLTETFDGFDFLHRDAETPGGTDNPRVDAFALPHQRKVIFLGANPAGSAVETGSYQYGTELGSLAESAPQVVATLPTAGTSGTIGLRAVSPFQVLYAKHAAGSADLVTGFIQVGTTTVSETLTPAASFGGTGWVGSMFAYRVNVQGTGVVLADALVGGLPVTKRILVPLGSPVTAYEDHPVEYGTGAPVASTGASDSFGEDFGTFFWDDQADEDAVRKLTLDNALEHLGAAVIAVPTDEAIVGVHAVAQERVAVETSVGTGPITNRTLYWREYDISQVVGGYHPNDVAVKIFGRRFGGLAQVGARRLWLANSADNNYLHLLGADLPSIPPYEEPSAACVLDLGQRVVAVPIAQGNDYVTFCIPDLSDVVG